MHTHPRLTVIVPAFDEAPNIAPLVREVAAVFESLDQAAELIIVDDGSGDGTSAEAEALMAEFDWLRVLALPRRMGQSAAFWAGIRAARGDLVAMLDADLQNDPADLPRLMDLLESQGADWVQGVRRKRSDRNTQTRRFGAWVGRVFRARVLGDTIRDTGCSCRVFRREIGLAIPLQFRGMHRFMPVYARRLGHRVIEADVNHRPRLAGAAKYGTWGRAATGLRDLFAVRWMFHRVERVEFTERAPARPARIAGSTAPAGAAPPTNGRPPHAREKVNA